jgi:hypothetical protein
MQRRHSFSLRADAMGAGMTRSGAPIEFRDAGRVRWTVTRSPTGQAGLVKLDFVSEDGERRTCEVVPLEDESWAELNDGAWQSLLATARSE